MAGLLTAKQVEPGRISRLFSWC